MVGKGKQHSAAFKPSFEPAPRMAAKFRLMRLIEREFTERPFYGSRRITASLVRQGEAVNR
jgi:putative transposase